MSDSALGGRSSATPRSHAEKPTRLYTQEALGSQSSPLQEFKPQQPQRKAPLHFPPIEMGFRSVIIYLTVCVQQKNRYSRIVPRAANRRSMGSGYFLVR